MIEKTCTKCGTLKPLATFYSHKTCKYGVSAICTDCNKAVCVTYYQANKIRLNAAMAEYAANNAKKIAEYQREYREANKEKISAQAKERATSRPEYVRRKGAARRRQLYRELRNLILNELGGACYCCGLADIRFLTIDHILGGGKQHRTLSGGKAKNGYIVLLEIQKEGIPKDKYRAACYNCNCARNLTKGKICPHQLDHA